MDSPRIAMNEPPKFGENQVPKRASRSSLDMKSLGRHTRIGRCAWYSIPGGDGMGMAWGQPGNHTRQSSGTAQGSAQRC